MLTRPVAKKLVKKPAKRFTGDETVLPLIRKLLLFLRGGVAEDGHSCFDCGNSRRTVTYHTAVLAQALVRASDFEIPSYDALANRAYHYLLALQRPDGGRVSHRRIDRVAFAGQ